VGTVVKIDGFVPAQVDISVWAGNERSVTQRADSSAAKQDARRRWGMRRNKLEVYIHFVWATWDRQPLITDDIERDLYRYISSACQDDKCDVIAIGGMPDHVHLLVKFPNTITMADLMHDVKGGSSRHVSQKLKPGEWFEWQGNYGAFSVGAREKSEIVSYIRKQKQHHAGGQVNTEIEETFEFVDKQGT
jgi:REP element-mobilizing transposase RayT